jgi:anti-sigma regulatory factor (Ser/Thr protein kinase)
MKVATDHPIAAPVPENEHVFALTRAFAGLPESVREARSWVAGFFAAPDAPDAALMASELVTNAIVHSASGLPGGSVTVMVAASEETVRVDVIDQGALPTSATAPRGLGKGLAIVARLADVFGADGCDRWFALRTGGAL